MLYFYARLPSRTLQALLTPPTPTDASSLALGFMPKKRR
jgi:hypothetical protein